MKMLVFYGISYQRLTQAFQQTFGIHPAFFARAPGRVNLIGKPEAIAKLMIAQVNMLIIADILCFQWPSQMTWSLQ